MMFTLREKHYLQEMTIPLWELAHPEQIQGCTVPNMVLPDSCVLLFIAEDLPQGKEVDLFVKILASMQLTPDQALHIFPWQIAQLSQHNLQWVWFAGCDSHSFEGVNLLQSPKLDLIQNHPHYKRDLWQQICSYHE